MSKLLIFGILTLLITIVSRRTLFNTKSHGFYRYFSWIGIALLMASNYKNWFLAPFSVNHLISWILLFYSTYIAIAGFILLIRKGKPGSSRKDVHLFSFEKTTELIDTGVFKYTRHPLYASLIFLTWALLMKNPTPILSAVAFLSTIFLYFCSRYDEKECIQYFGSAYEDYMKRTKMFIPFIF